MINTHLVMIVAILNGIQPLCIEHAKFGFPDKVAQVGLEGQHQIDLRMGDDVATERSGEVQ